MDIKNYLTPADVEKQEHLSLDRLKKFKPRFDSVPYTKTPRPSSNFIDLMNWTESAFSGVLSETKNLNKFVHNRIIIDGQFLKFCDENKVTVECLYKDSIISWNTDSNLEKYFVQGVFLIKSKDVEFLHAALFHKGNQNEDEISFFIICSESNYEKYIELRNNFDIFSQKRDRDSLYINVVESEPIPYTKDSTWEDLFLPIDLKNDIKKSVEGFLSSKDFYLKNKIPWKMGMILYGHPGNGKTSAIKTLISQYDFKPVTVPGSVNDDIMKEAFRYAEEQNPSLLYFEDLDSLLEKNVDVSTFLNLMDGISSKNGILIVATANEIKKLKHNIIDRPSRFDKKFEIPLPSQDMAQEYLKKWFGTLINAKKYKQLSTIAVDNKFSYAYLKELYISSMFEALSHNRKTPTDKDIDNTLKRLIKDKSILKDATVINTDKYFK